MAESIKPTMHIYPDVTLLNRAVAAEIVEIAHKANKKNGRFTLALSGGNTPKKLYNLLATEFNDKIPWDATHLFWGDERYVPKVHPESNYSMVWQSLISKVPIPRENVHPIPTESGSPEKDAETYNRLLKNFFTLHTGKINSQTFDLVLLGIGGDGHTASLFPGSPAHYENIEWVVPTLAPETYSTMNRISITPQVINASKNVFFMVSGYNKKLVVKSILDNLKDQMYPASMIQPKNGRIVWFLDKATAFNSTE